MQSQASCQIISLFSLFDLIKGDPPIPSLKTMAKINIYFCTIALLESKYISVSELPFFSHQNLMGFHPLNSYLSVFFSGMLSMDIITCTTLSNSLQMKLERLQRNI
jgi:hypothetical protein